MLLKDKSSIGKDVETKGSDMENIRALLFFRLVNFKMIGQCGFSATQTFFVQSRSLDALDRG